MNKWQRHVLGAVGLLLVLGLGLALLMNRTEPAVSIGFRVGWTLLAIWLALPQLQNGQWKGSVLVALGIVALVILIAARPRLLPAVLGILILLAIVQFIFRYVTRKLKNP